MNDSFSYRSIPRTGGRNTLIIVSLLVIAIIGVDILLHGIVRNQLHKGVAILGGWTESGKNLLRNSFFSSRISGDEANAERLKQIERAAAYEVLKEENDELRALLNVAGTNDPGSAGVTAPIVSSTYSSPYGTFLIGAGSADGITKGSIVTTSTGFVVGIVGNPGTHTSIVSEIFAPGASTEINVHGVAGIAEGFGGGNARMQVPRDVLIQVGDPVRAPALGQRPVGIVGEIASSSGSASQEVYMRIPVNLSSLSFVYVIRN